MRSQIDVVMSGVRRRNSTWPMIFIFTILHSIVSHAHKGESHVSSDAADTSPKIQEADADVFKEINEAYVSNVKPLFTKSCFDCHSSSTNYPWYSKLPGAKQLIKKDITEAKTHLDMANDFPFKSHSTPKEDLVAISKSLADGTMPPFRYRVLHWDSSLSSENKSTVLKWVNESLKKLK